jgi:hypothetical protein
MKESASGPGILWISGDDKYLQEVKISARSAKKLIPDIQRALITDSERMKNHDLFDKVIVKENILNGFIDKVRYISDSPFDHTLYVDTDTYFCKDVSEMFDLFEKFHLAAALAPGRETGQINRDSCPESFPEYNTGVILFDNSKIVIGLFEKWLEIYKKEYIKKDAGDQPAFREAAWMSDINIHTIPSEYNCRTVYPGAAGDEVKIIHGRHRNMEKIKNKLNASGRLRVHYVNWGQFKVFEHPHTHLQILLHSAVRDGIGSTFLKICNRIVNSFYYPNN